MVIRFAQFIRSIEISTGIFWCYAGVSKCVLILSEAVARGPLDPAEAIGVSQSASVAPTWVESFPMSLIVTVSLFEIVLGFMFLVRKTLLASAAGSLLLAGFALMLWIAPPEPGQKCGCLGASSAFEAVSPASKLALLGGIHAMLVASVLPRISNPASIAHQPPDQ